MTTWITKITKNDEKSARERWRTVAVSKIGAAHIKAKVPCQDASRCFADPDTLIACVSDGAGSARYSDKGASAAVEEFVGVSRKLLKNGKERSLATIVGQAFAEAQLAVLKIADDEPREYAATLLGLIATRGALAAGQVGDGAIIVDGKVVMDSDSGEYANETSFITEPNANLNTFSASGKVSRVAILTDGLENIVLKNNGHERAPHEPFFDPMYEWLQNTDEPDRTAQLGEFLVSERVRSRTTDDVTLLLAMR